MHSVTHWGEQCTGQMYEVSCCMTDVVHCIFVQCTAVYSIPQYDELECLALQSSKFCIAAHQDTVQLSTLQCITVRCITVHNTAVKSAAVWVVAAPTCSSNFDQVLRFCALSIVPATNVLMHTGCWGFSEVDSAHWGAHWGAQCTLGCTLHSAI